MIVHTALQGSPEWLASRRGVITASRFKDARDFKALTKAMATSGMTRGEPSSALLGYAYDVARERAGGSVPTKFQNDAMRTGTEQEPLARMAYQNRTGQVVDEAGFITTNDLIFGVSVDGLVEDDGIIEIKTMVSSNTLFAAFVERDISAYVDQCLGALWLLERQWCDLILWAPDMSPAGGSMAVIRIDRDDDSINELEADLIAFWQRVLVLETKLRSACLSASAAPALAAPELEAA